MHLNGLDLFLAYGQNRKWIKVGVDSEYTLSVTLKRLNRHLQRDCKAYTPK